MLKFGFDNQNSLGKVAIALTNIIPLIGILLFGWSAFDLVFLYWLENVIIGIFVILRLLIRPDNAPIFMIGGLFLSAFFCFHYGFFTYGHGTFVFALFGENLDISDQNNLLSSSFELLQDKWLLIAFAGLFVGHLVDYVSAYKNKLITGMGEEMTRPYQRIVILHLSIIAGGLIALVLENSSAVAFLLIAIKLFFDLKRPQIFNAPSGNSKKANSLDKISPDASDEEIKLFIREKMSKPYIKINRTQYEYNSVSEMVSSAQYSKAEKLYKLFMPKRMFELYQETIDEMLIEEREARKSFKSNG